MVLDHEAEKKCNLLYGKFCILTLLVILYDNKETMNFDKFNHMNSSQELTNE